MMLRGVILVKLLILSSAYANPITRIAARWLLALGAVAALTTIGSVLHVNIDTAGFLYLIVVVLLSLTGDLISSLLVSIASALCLTYFFARPVLSMRVDDPLDLVAITAFVTTSFVISRLVSEVRAKSEIVLSSVNRKLVDAAERERRRIGRDLHDDVCQRLALFSCQLEQVRNDLGGRASTNLTRIAALQEQISEIATDVQAISHELHSSKLEYLGIEAAMRGFCRELAQQRKVGIDFKSKDLTLPLSPEISLCLFRVLQEALHNSAKHSGALDFKVELVGTSEGIHLAVHDSGIGFNPQAAMSGPGLGLTSMKERVKLVKGKFSINSHPGTGTTIHAWVPSCNRSSETCPERKVS